MPPAASSTKLPAASTQLNVPVMAAATAKRNNTIPVASLTRLSPSSSTTIRRGSRSPASTALAATASGGDTMAPSAKHAAQGKPGTTRCATTPTTSVVNATAPTASCTMIRRLARKSRQAV